MSKHLLTKSASSNGLAYDRFLWIYQNDRKRLPEVDESTQLIFDQGHVIGNLAKSLFPNGIEIDWHSGHEAGIAQTRAAVGKRKPIFEAGFQGHCGTYRNPLNNRNRKSGDSVCSLSFARLNSQTAANNKQFPKLLCTYRRF